MPTLLFPVGGQSVHMNGSSISDYLCFDSCTLLCQSCCLILYRQRNKMIAYLTFHKWLVLVCTIRYVIMNVTKQNQSLVKSEIHHYFIRLWWYVALVKLNTIMVKLADVKDISSVGGKNSMLKVKASILKNSMCCLIVMEKYTRIAMVLILISSFLTIVIRP